MNNRLLISKVILAIIMIFNITYGVTTKNPDDFHISYGVPLSWGTNQQVTIAGPVDTWSINMSNLVLDMVFWITLVLALDIVYERMESKST